MRCLLCTLVAAGVVLAPSFARGDFTPIYGSALIGDDPSVSQPSLRVFPGFSAGEGLGIGASQKFSGGQDLGYRAFRWDSSGTTELGTLQPSNNGSNFATAYAVNSSGLIVGASDKYVNNSNIGLRAVKWLPGSAQPVELGGLPGESSLSSAVAVNADGFAIGSVRKLVNGANRGDRAVRWDASGTATELDSLGVAPDGIISSGANAINSTGTVVGAAAKWSGNSYAGLRAVRWAGTGTAATELGRIGGSNARDHIAFAVNDSGTAVGLGEVKLTAIYDPDDEDNRPPSDVASHAVRWEGDTAVQLGDLGVDRFGFTVQARAINNSGTAIGVARKFDNGEERGDRPVRWDPASTNAFELQLLGVDSSGSADGEAWSINRSGLIVGRADVFSNGVLSGHHAVLWRSDGSVVDLNTLIAPDSGWTLFSAYAITDSGWVTGSGMYDPDGSGGADPSSKLFLMQVPEPSGVGIMMMAATAVSGRRRRQ